MQGIGCTMISWRLISLELYGSLVCLLHKFWSHVGVESG